MHFRFSLFLFLFFVLTSRIHATHIVGGEMNYTCLGGNQYEITLVIFRDCYNANPSVWFDNPASIGVFHGQTNVLLSEILIPWNTNLNDTLSPMLTSECFVAPPDVCVHTTTYTTIVTLPPQIGGYTLVYQRCCRNQTISNIVNPLGTGATFSVFISQTALLECNSNPKFNAWPPLYICVNEPIEFDQSAFDVDGDSIVYKLCTPLDGATPTNPMPQPPFNPPYPLITWIDPPYNVLNMLNGSPGGVPLSIDLHTGLLTGLPNTIGQFVVGICVEEYRAGSLISTTRRDFQYNVGECGQSVSSFYAPEIQCGDLTVAFQNLSQNSDEYLWYFNDPDNPGATSSSVNPAYTYSDTGTYTVVLIAQPGNVCADTFTQSITLLPNSLIPAFSYEITECADSLVIEVTDLSVDTLSSIVNWSWNLSNILLSNEPNPTFTLYENTNALLTLTVTAANGCQQQAQQWIPAFIITEEIADTLTMCKGDSVALNPVFDPLLVYFWSPGATLSSPITPNPWATPDTTTTYTVTLINFNGCATVKQLTVFVPPPVNLQMPPDTTTCDPIVSLFAQSDTGVEYYWASDPDFDAILGYEPALSVEPLGSETYYLLVRDAYGCGETGQVTIIGNGVNIALDSSEVVCQDEILQLTAINTDTDDQLTYHWSPDSLIAAGQQSATVSVMLPDSGFFTIYLQSANQLGCQRLDSVVLFAIDTTDLGAGFSYTQCGGLSVLFNYQGANAPVINWNFGDPQQPAAGAFGPNAAYTFPDTGWYAIQLTLPDSVACPDTTFFPIYVGLPSIIPDFDWSYPFCGDSIVVQFNNLSVNGQSFFTGFQWTFSNGITSGEDSPQLVFFQNEALIVKLFLESADGCVDSIEQSLNIQLLEPDLPDTLTACFNQPVELNPGFNPDWIYQWSPPNGLSDVNAPNPLANPAQTTTYSVTVTDNSGTDVCAVVRETTVIIPPPFDWYATADTAVCEPVATLAAQSNAAVTFTWSDNPGFTNVIGTDAQLTVIPGRPSAYYVQATDAYGCVLTDTIVVGNYAIAVSAQPIYTICVGDSVQLQVQNLQPGDILSYLWSPAGGILSGQGTGSPWVGPPASTTYTFIVGNQYGCQDTGQVEVDIFDFVPPLAVTAIPDTIFLGQSAQLAALTDPGVTFSWSPAATLTNAAIFNPIATPGETTLYEVVITTPDGCTNMGAVRVVVLDPICEEPYIFVPSAFSPNGDGKNDLFRVRGNAIDEIYVAVYDRWGEKVFESNDVYGGWDGYYNGKLLPPDVYGYYLRVLCLGGEEFIRKGNLTLIR